MSIPHAGPGQVVNVGPLGRALAGARSRALVRGEELEVIQLIVPRGKEIPEHRAKGEIAVQCLEGEIALAARGRTENLKAGEFLYLPTGEPHSVRGVEHASVLVTVVLPGKEGEADWGGRQRELPGVERDEAARRRGIFLSAVQAAVLVGGLALLFAVAANGILVGAACVAAVLAVLGCLHYWTWGRRMTRAAQEAGQGSRHAGARGLRFTNNKLAVSGKHSIGG